MRSDSIQRLIPLAQPVSAAVTDHGQISNSRPCGLGSSGGSDSVARSLIAKARLVSSEGSNQAANLRVAARNDDIELVKEWLDEYQCEFSAEDNARFQAYMRAIVLQLNPKHDFDKDPIEFVLDRRDLDTAYHIGADDKGVKKSFIGISRESIQDKSLLYWTVGHEYGHHLSFMRGTDENSKAEEMYSDLHYLQRMEELGLDATVAERFFSTEASLDISMLKLAFTALKDVHPLSSSRAGLIETCLGAISNMHGGLNVETGRLAPKDEAHTSFCEFCSQVWEIENTLEPEAVLKSDTEKISINATVIETICSEIVDPQTTIERRQELILDLGRKLELVGTFTNYYDPNTASRYYSGFSSIATKLADTAVYIADNYASLGLSSNCSPTIASLFGIACVRNRDLDIGGLKSKVSNFVQAETYESMQSSAEELVKAFDKYKDLFKDFDISKALRIANDYDSLAFVLPSQYTLARTMKKVGLRLPWDKHVDAFANNDSRDIRKALMLLGVLDARVFDDPEILEYWDGSYRHPLAYSCASYSEDVNNRAAYFHDKERELNIAAFDIVNGKLCLHDFFYQVEYFDGLQAGFIFAHRREELQRLGDELFEQACNAKPEEFEKISAELERLSTMKIVLTDSLYRACDDEDPEGFQSFMEGRVLLTGLSNIDKNIELFFRVNDHVSVAQNIQELLSKTTELISKPETKDKAKEIFAKIMSNFKLLEGDKLGLSSREIALNFLFEHAENWDQDEILAYLSSAEYFQLYSGVEDQENAINYDTGYLSKIQEVFGLEEIETCDDIVARMNEIAAFLPKVEDEEFLLAWMEAEILAAIELYEEDSPVPIADIVLNLPDSLLKRSTALQEVIKLRVDQENFDTLDIDQKINLYTRLSGHRLIENRKLEDDLAKSCLQSLATIQDLDTKVATIEVLFASSVMDWPDFRKELLGQWVEATYLKSGYDEDFIYASAASAVNKLRVRDAYALTNLLADRCQSAADLSARLGSLVNEGLIDSAVSVDQKYVAMMEIVKVIANNNASLRDQLIDLLCDNKPDAYKDVEAKIKKAVSQDLNISNEQRQRVSEFFNSNPYTRRRFWELFHRNFWDSPLTARTIILKELTLPHHKDQFLAESFFWGATDYVIRKLIDGKTDYAQETVKTLVDFVQVLSKRERSLFVSAVLGAAEENKGKANVGAKLASLFAMLGPAWIKLGQAIHSYDKTPEDIRSGMEVMKLDVDAPTRWHLFEQMDRVLPADLRSRIVHVGERLGSASYYFVYRVTLDDGKDYALALLKPYAKERSEHGFTQMQNLIEQTKKSGDNSEYLASLSELVDQSKALAEVETNYANAAKQEQVAEKLCGNKQATVNGNIFHFDIARNIRVGDGFRLMELAEGETFNKTDKSQNPEFYKQFGLAYHTLEMVNILSGGFFDEDRHGGQMKIVDNRAKLFDFGAIKIKQKPFDEELEEMGRLFALGYKALSEQKESQEDIAKSLSAVFISAIQSYRASGKPSSGYLASAHKAWLALADFRRDFSRTDYEAMFISVLKSGRVHNKIQDGLLTELGLSKLAFNTAMSFKRATVSIR